MILKEYGGCLPQERYLLTQPHESNLWFNLNVAYLNSGRTAIYYALCQANAQAVALPYYTCPSLKRFLLRQGIRVREYHLGDGFVPVSFSKSAEEKLVWTNYNGCVNQQTIQSMCQQYGSSLILDNAQAFFAPPCPDVYNIYSARKFIGVPDGAFVVKNDIIPATFSKDTQSEHAKFLHLAKESGANAAYSAYLQNEQRFENDVYAISDYTYQLLTNVDFKEIQNHRRRNYEILHSVLKDVSDTTFAVCGNTPFFYPFISTKKNIREKLLTHNVYVPRWWKHLVDDTSCTSFERNLVENLCPLAIDQRYTDDDMYALGHIVLKCL